MNRDHNNIVMLSVLERQLLNLIDQVHKNNFLVIKIKNPLCANKLYASSGLGERLSSILRQTISGINQVLFWYYDILLRAMRKKYKT